MTNIIVFFVPSGNPTVICNGEYIEMGGGYLSLKNEMIRMRKETSGFQFVKSIMAWGGKVVSHTKNTSPAQNLQEAVSFKSIILDEGDKNTRDCEFIDTFYPILALLTWCNNEHFINHGISKNFECLVCGKMHFSPYTPLATPARPTFCESPKCYSHEIWKMLDPEYTIKEKTGK